MPNPAGWLTIDLSFNSVNLPVIIWLDMSPFKIQLKLETSGPGLDQLRHWPAADFAPDFVVAAAGKVRFEFNGRPLVAENGRLKLSSAVNPGQAGWLPDYIAGFALNLGRAARRMKSRTETGTSAIAKFIGEPVELRLERVEAQIIAAEVRHDKASIARLEAPAGLLLDEVGRALQDFYNQLLEVNPHLAAHPDVKTLYRKISELIC